MQANELMRGNIVKRPRSLTDDVIMPYIIDTVTGIDSFGAVEFYRDPTQEGFKCPDKHLAGVELTPEILEKAGFEKVKFETNLRGEYNLGRYHVSLKMGKLILVSMGMCHHLCECKYLHQMQNLFFLIKGHPLQIEL